MVDWIVNDESEISTYEEEFSLLKLLTFCEVDDLFSRALIRQGAFLHFNTVFIANRQVPT